MCFKKEFNFKKIMQRALSTYNTCILFQSHSYTTLYFHAYSASLSSHMQESSTQLFRTQRIFEFETHTSFIGKSLRSLNRKEKLSLKVGYFKSDLGWIIIDKVESGFLTKHHEVRGKHWEHNLENLVNSDNVVPFCLLLRFPSIFSSVSILLLLSLMSPQYALADFEGETNEDSFGPIMGILAFALIVFVIALFCRVCCKCLAWSCCPWCDKNPTNIQLVLATPVNNFVGTSNSVDNNETMCQGPPPKYDRLEDV